MNMDVKYFELIEAEKGALVSVEISAPQLLPPIVWVIPKIPNSLSQDESQSGLELTLSLVRYQAQVLVSDLWEMGRLVWRLVFLLATAGLMQLRRGGADPR
jgi:hypothetical protein